MSLGALATSHAEMPSHRVILTHTDLHGVTFAGKWRCSVDAPWRL